MNYLKIQKHRMRLRALASSNSPSRMWDRDKLVAGRNEREKYPPPQGPIANQCFLQEKKCASGQTWGTSLPSRVTLMDWRPGSWASYVTVKVSSPLSGKKLASLTFLSRCNYLNYFIARQWIDLHIGLHVGAIWKKVLQKCPFKMYRVPFVPFLKFLQKLVIFEWP